MGRIKTRLLKSVTHEILQKDGDKFVTDFEKNKAIIEESATFGSKKLRNIVAGYATRLKKAGKY